MIWGIVRRKKTAVKLATRPADQLPDRTARHRAPAPDAVAIAQRRRHRGARRGSERRVDKTDPAPRRLTRSHSAGITITLPAFRPSADRPRRFPREAPPEDSSHGGRHERNRDTLTKDLKRTPPYRRDATPQRDGGRVSQITRPPRNAGGVNVRSVIRERVHQAARGRSILSTKEMSNGRYKHSARDR